MTGETEHNNERHSIQSRLHHTFGKVSLMPAQLDQGRSSHAMKLHGKSSTLSALHYIYSASEIFDEMFIKSDLKNGELLFGT
jgi:hypothetical protein